MRIALLSLLALTAVAHAQAPGATDAKPAPADTGTSEQPAPVTYTFGADGRIGVGDLVDFTVGGRFELGIAPGHSLVVRAGIGTRSWFETEIDDPTFRELFAHVGYRLSSKHLFVGVELGEEWFKAHYLPEYQMSHTPHWFDEFTVGGVAGFKVGPVRVSLDYTKTLTHPIHQVGLQLGVDVLSL